MDRDAFDRVCGRLDGYRDRIIELQTELVKRPAIHPDSGGEGETMHGPNEYCLLSNLVGDAKVFAHLILRED